LAAIVMRARRRREAGTTLLEIAMVLAIIAVVGAFALTFGVNTVRGIEVEYQSTRTELHVVQLRSAVVNWYRGAYCRLSRPETELFPLLRSVQVPEFPIDSTVEELDGTVVDLNGYVLDGTRLPALGTEENAYDWRIALNDENQAQLQIFWHYPEGLGDRIAAAARKLGGHCDDDNDADTVEPCDGEPAEERIVLPVLLSDGTFRDPLRRHRVESWLDAFGIECDADDDGRFDLFCDSRIPGSPGSSGRPCDGRLDFDLTEDCAVDAGDWRALGC
jgi:hypothetical protein